MRITGFNPDLPMQGLGLKVYTANEENIAWNPIYTPADSLVMRGYTVNDDAPIYPWNYKLNNFAEDLGYSVNGVNFDMSARLMAEPMSFDDGTQPARDFLYDQNNTDRRATFLTSINPSTYSATGLGDEKAWFCPSLGGQFDDLSSNGNDATVTNGDIQAYTNDDTNDTGWRGYGCNGVDDWFRIPSTTLHGSASISLSGWYRLDGNNTLTNGNWYSIFGQHDFGFDYQNSTGQLFLQAHATSGNIRAGASWSTDANDYDINSQPTPQYDEWVHVCATWDDATSTCSLYIDGTLATTGSYADSLVTSPSMNFQVAAQGASQRFPFQGSLDDLRAYDRVLSTDEITHLASARGVLGQPGGTPPPPTGGFYNPFSNKIFNPHYTRRIG